MIQHTNIATWNRQRGFALVVSLVMLVLLVVIAVGMLGLSSVALRTSGHELAAREARANARLAMRMAIARLQEDLGDDRRITAGADLSDAGSAQPALTGVWDSWASDHAEDPSARAVNLDSIKRTRFRRWLVSHPDAAAPTRTDFAATAPGADAVGLFSRARDGFDLAARPVAIGGNAGAFAWAVTQENTKARINLGVGDTPQSPNHVIHAPIRPNLALANALKHPEDDGWPLRPAKILSPAQTALDPAYGTTPATAGTLSRDFTTHAAGVLSDVVRGGLKTDLSLAFELDDARFNANSWNGTPNPFRGGSAPGGEVPLFKPVNSGGPVTATVEFSSATNTHTFATGAVPTFDTLRSHHRQYLHLYQNEGVPTAFQRHHASRYWQPGQAAGVGVNPVFNRLMLFMSMWLDQDDIMNVVLTPLVTLWNPYNVALEAPGYVIYPWIDFPVFVEWSVTPASGQPISTRYSLSGHVSRRVAGGRQVPPYFFLELTERGNGLTQIPVRLEPGEVRLFAPVTRTPVRYQRTAADSVRTLRMRPVGSPDELHTEGGFALRQTDGQESSRNLGHRFRPGDTVRLTTEFDAARFHYLVTMEDAGRITRREPNLISEVQVYHGYGAQGRNMRFSTPVMGYHDLKQRPRPYGVLETFLKTAAQPGQLSDLMLTVNPRQRYIYAMLSGGDFTTGPHYQSSFRPIADIIGAGLQVTPDGRRSFHGATNDVGSGRDRLAFFELPREAPISLAAFQHADLVDSAFAPGHAFANAWASPYVPSTQAARLMPTASSTGRETFTPSPGLAVYDHSFLLNHALWDGYFLSSIGPVVERRSMRGSPNVHNGVIVNERRGIDEVVRAWLDDPVENPLRNPRFTPHRGSAVDSEIVARLGAPDGALHAASHMLVEGTFNINSTSVEAWVAVLASLRDQAIVIEDLRAGGNGTHTADGATPFPRKAAPQGAANDPWGGFRQLDDAQLRALAGEIVAEVRARGPFLSLGEFVNRRLGVGESALKGALQAAIDRSGVNRDFRIQPFATDAFPYSSNISEAFTGAGLPGWLTQGDLLNGLGPVMTPRSDTFVIRTMGESGGPGPRVRVFAEAVVQRTPEWLDPSQPATTRIGALNPVNARFGRRFQVVAFRFLPSPPAAGA